jgi:tetratricopeptide (TPR) repeat protein
MAWLAAALLPLLLYANTLGHGFVLDDVMVVSENAHVQKGTGAYPEILLRDTFDGYLQVKAGNAQERMNQLPGGRYRPLSLLVFALLVEHIGNQPFFFHLLNVLAYTGASLILLASLNLFWPMRQSRRPLLSLPFLATVLFVAHPLHTEVVANVKSLDEILAFSGAVAAMFFAKKAIQKPCLLYYLLSFAAFSAALSAKEHVITFLALIPLALWLFPGSSKKQIARTALPLLIAALLFLWVRQSVVGGTGGQHPPPSHLMNNPFLEASAAEYAGTVAYTLLLYLKLLALPHPLTTDYYPYHIELVSWQGFWPLLSILVYVLLTAAALAGLYRKRAWAFGPALYLVALLPMSNVLFSVGVFMAERFLFLPSLGFAFTVAWLLAHKLRPKTAAILMLVLLACYSYKTISRNWDWKSNFTLMLADAETSKGSAFSNSILGAAYLEKAKKENSPAMRRKYFQESFKYLERSLDAVPTHLYAIVNLGNAHYEYGRDYPEAIRYYAKALQLSPSHEYSYQTLKGIVSQTEDIGLKIKAYHLMLSHRPRSYELNYALGELYGRYRQMPDSAVLFMKRALEEKPESVPALSNLAFLMAQKGQLREAYPILKKAHRLAPKDQMVRRNLMRMATQLGDEKMIQKLQQ